MLVNGAGGGVRALALQVAKASGADVTGVDSTGKLGMLRSLGADRVIDYTQEDFTRGDVRYDFIFDVPAGKITPIIDSTYPLADTREAFRHMIEDELQGKVIITPG